MQKRPIAPPRNVKLAILLAVLLLAHAPPAQAALLCSESGPYVSNDYLELSDFEVTGPEPLMVGDTVTVSFTLKANEFPRLFGKQGAFVAARDPDGINRSFGHTYQDPVLQVGESIRVQASMTVDKEGEWIFWPSCHITENSPYYYGEHFAPDEWHACYLTARSQPDLTVEEIFWNPPLPEIGDPVTVAVAVKNIGAPSSEWVHLLLWGCCDLSSQVHPLESGERVTIYFEDSPLIFEEPGEFEITATIDTASKIAESNEANNEISEVITVEGVLPPLSVSIFTDPVPSGESNEVAVLVTANGDPVQDAFVHLSATHGDLDPDAGTTDADGGFVLTFTAPVVRVETMYTINAEAEIGDRAGEGSVSDLITVPRETPPTAYMEIPHDTAEEGGGEDSEVIVQTNISSASEYISKHISDPAVLAAMIVVLAAGALVGYREYKNKNKNKNKLNKTGSIRATSDPSDAVLFVDGAYKGRSPKTMDNVLIGTHTVLFLKRGYFGYEKNAVVVANQTTPVHRDLTKMPEVKLKLSADPAEIVADRESRSTIWIEIVTKDDNEIPIPVPEEITVVLEADIGTIESPVKIPAGCASIRSTLISARSSGTATVKAEAEYRKIVKLEGSTTVEFMDAESE